MPGFITVARYVFLVFKIAQDKTVIGQLFMDLSPDLRILHHILVFIDVHTVDDEVKVESQSGVMLGIAGHGNVFRHIGRAVFCRKVIHYLLLRGDAAAGGIQIDVNAFLLKSIFQLQI